ncbi:MAG TPA: hypothetical protein PK299_14365 [Anaerolineales bacterium]|nr:hypothetical protein [Anaerolineales bacterium]
MTHPESSENAPIPKEQNFYDNVWILFLLSLAISTVIYNIWGLIDILSVPPAP